jgi:hypothetical protein
LSKRIVLVLVLVLEIRPKIEDEDEKENEDDFRDWNFSSFDLQTSCQIIDAGLPDLVFDKGDT